MTDGNQIGNRARQQQILGENSKKVVVYTSMSWGHACVAIRLSGPLQLGDCELILGDANDVDAKDVSGADLVVFHREFPALNSNYGRILWKCRMENKPVIYELDDLLTKIPADHPAFEFLSSLSSCIVSAIEDADAVIVSSEKLKSLLDTGNANIVVIPNYLDESLWRFQTPRINPDVITIGYAATVTHRADGEMIGEILSSIADKYGARVRFEFVGVPPPVVLHGNPSLAWHELDELDYEHYVRIMNEKTIDIAIAPLTDNDFNRCKSCLKYLEYSALGAAGIFSKLEPYESIIVDGENGLLASNSADWTRGLERLIEDNAFRAQVAENAQKHVVNEFLLGPKRQKIRSAWLALAGL